MKRIISLSLDADVVEKIKQLAENSDRSFSQNVNIILREHIKKEEKNKK